MRIAASAGLRFRGLGFRVCGSLSTSFHNTGGSCKGLPQGVRQEWAPFKSVLIGGLGRVEGFAVRV